MEILEILFGECQASDGILLLADTVSGPFRRVRLGDRENIRTVCKENRTQFFKTTLLEPATLSPGSHGSERDSKSLVAVCLDVDCGKPGYCSRQDVAAALEAMATPPTVCVDSDGDSGGIHAYWKLDAPLELDETSRPRAKTLTRAWEKYVRGELVGLECSTNAKGDEIRLDTGQSFHRLLRVTDYVRESGESVRVGFRSGREYSLEELEGLVAESVRPDGPDSKKAEKIVRQAPELNQGDETIEDYIRSRDSVEDVAALMECQGHNVWRVGTWFEYKHAASESSNTMTGTIGKNRSSQGVFQITSFSPNSPFGQTNGITPLQAIADLEHSGDVTRAAEAIFRSRPDSLADLAARIDISPFIESLDLEAPLENSTGVPLALMNDGGFLERFSAWVLENSAVDHPELAFSAALHVLSLGSSRRIRDNSLEGTYPNVFLINVATTGSGKESPRRLSKQFLAGAGATNLIGAEELTSGAGLSNSVLYSSDGVAGHMLDELGDAIARMGERNAPSWVQTISSTMKNIFSASGSSYWKPQAKAGEFGDLDRSFPHCTLSGATTPERLYNALTDEQLESGLIGRILTFEARGLTYEEIERMNFEKEPTAIPESLLSAFAKVAGKTGDLSDFQASSVDEDQVDKNGKPKPIANIGNVPIYAWPKPDWLTVPISREAKTISQKFRRRVMQKNLGHQENGERVDLAIWNRASEKVAKFALLFAVSRWSVSPGTSLEITVEDMRRAVDLTVFVTRRFITRLRGAFVSASSREAMTRREVVLRMLEKAEKKNDGEAVKWGRFCQLSPLVSWPKNVRRDTLADLEELECVQVKKSGPGFRVRITEAGRAYHREQA